jgi:hypothetical protein
MLPEGLAKAKNLTLLKIQAVDLGDMIHSVMGTHMETLWEAIG